MICKYTKFCNFAKIFTKWQIMFHIRIIIFIDCNRRRGMRAVNAAYPLGNIAGKGGGRQAGNVYNFIAS